LLFRFRRKRTATKGEGDERSREKRNAIEPLSLPFAFGLTKGKTEELGRESPPRWPGAAIEPQEILSRPLFFVPTSGLCKKAYEAPSLLWSGKSEK
jgi:hypothetical protein